MPTPSGELRPALARCKARSTCAGATPPIICRMPGCRVHVKDTKPEGRAGPKLRPAVSCRESGEVPMKPRTIGSTAKLIAVCCGAVLCAGYQSAAAGKAQIVTFDPAGSIGTYPWQANEDGSIVGCGYDSAENVTKGFIRAPDGTITEFDHVDSKVTAAYDITN